jgi:aldehyde dehydrogenase (NAD+)
MRTQTDAGKGLLIDGRLVAGMRTFASVNPATGDVLGLAPDATAAEAERSVAAARAAFDDTAWATDTALRVRCLEQFHQTLTEHLEELRELTIAEVGAPRTLTHGAQLEQPIEMVRFYTDLLRDYPMSEDLDEVDIRGQRHRRWVE